MRIHCIDTGIKLCMRCNDGALERDIFATASFFSQLPKI